MSYLNIILDTYEFSKTDQQGLISALELVELPIDIDNSKPLTQALHNFNNILQETFLRASGSERQQLSDKFLNQKEDLVPLLSAFIKEVNSGNDCPSKILLGAAEKGVRERLDVLVDINNRGHHTEIVYPLGSERELWPIHEPLTTKLVATRTGETIDIVTNKFNELFETVIKMDNNRKLYSDAELTRETNKARVNTVKYYRNKGISWPTETDLMDNIINNEYKEKLPNIEFKKVVNCRNKINKDGELVRADTYDTLIEMWNIHKIEIMSAMDKNDKAQMSIITTQPFAHYQYQQTIKAFHHLPIEVFITAGKVKPDSINIAIAFDSLARTIYAGKEIATEKLEIIDSQKEVSITNPQSEL